MGVYASEGVERFARIFTLYLGTDWAVSCGGKGGIFIAVHCLRPGSGSGTKEKMCTFRVVWFSLLEFK